MPKIIAGIILFTIVATPCMVSAQEKKPEPLQAMWHWIKEKVRFFYNQIYFLLTKEVEQRKPDAEDEFKKEVQEIKEEAPSLWQRFLDLIK